MIDARHEIPFESDVQRRPGWSSLILEFGTRAFGRRRTVLAAQKVEALEPGSSQRFRYAEHTGMLQRSVRHMRAFRPTFHPDFMHVQISSSPSESSSLSFRPNINGTRSTHRFEEEASTARFFAIPSEHGLTVLSHQRHEGCNPVHGRVIMIMRQASAPCTCVLCMLAAHIRPQTMPLFVSRGMHAHMCTPNNSYLYYRTRCWMFLPCAARFIINVTCNLQF